MHPFRQSRDNGIAHLLTRQHYDGFVGDRDQGVWSYYKPLTALQTTGHTRASSKLCSWIRKHGMTAEGDFGPRSGDGGGYSYLYANAWVVVGAQRLGQFDIAHRGMDFIERYWDSESGGMFCDMKEQNADTLQEMMVTSYCGVAAAATGRIDTARGIGRWLKMMMDAQPDFPARLYTAYRKTTGLVTDPSKAGEAVVIAAADKDQHFFQPGVAAGFLCRLYQATGEPEWLSLAKEYLTFADHASDYLFNIVRAGKVGWAASLLYTLTGETKYRDMANRVGNNLIKLQLPGGAWSGVGGTTPVVDSTAERVVWMDEIWQAVGE